MAEGIARDTIRAIQQARKDAGLNVSDRINLTVSAPQETFGGSAHPRGTGHWRDPSGFPGPHGGREPDHYGRKGSIE